MNPAVSIAEPWMWAAFIGFVLVMLALDRFVLGGRKAHTVGVKEAALWSLAWLGRALILNAGGWWYLNGTWGEEVADKKAARKRINQLKFEDQGFTGVLQSSNPNVELELVEGEVIATNKKTGNKKTATPKFFNE